MNKRMGFFCLAGFFFVAVFLTTNKEVESVTKLENRLLDEQEISLEPREVKTTSKSEFVDQVAAWRSKVSRASFAFV